jgi:hypothetical protein
MQMGASELHGLHMEALELTNALNVLLRDPEAVQRSWLAGEDPFLDARGGESAEEERLSGRT